MAAYGSTIAASLSRAVRHAARWTSTSPGFASLFAGYTLIRVKSREEALEWTKRFPNPAIHGKDGEIEVRQLFELDDFEQTEAVQRLRDLGIGSEEPKV